MSTITDTPTVFFADFACDIELARYHHAPDQICIQLLDQADGLPVATATVCVSGWQPQPDYVLIKDYSENAGILDALRDAIIIGEPIACVPVGYALAFVCPLRIPVTV